MIFYKTFVCFDWIELQFLIKLNILGMEGMEAEIQPEEVLQIPASFP